MRPCVSGPAIADNEPFRWRGVSAVISILSGAAAIALSYLSWTAWAALCLGCGAVALFLWRPHLFFYFFIITKISSNALEVITPSDANGSELFALSADGILSIFFIFASILFLWKRRFDKVFLPRGSAILFLYVLMTALSVLYAKNTVLGLREVLHSLTYLAILVFGAHVLDTKRKNITALVAVLFSSIAPIVLGAAQFIFKTGEFAIRELMRIKGPCSGGAEYGNYLFIVSLVPVILVMTLKPLWQRAFVFLFIPAILASLVLTFTRSAWALTIVSYALFTALVWKASSWSNKLFASVLWVIVAGIAAAALPVILLRLNASVVALDFDTINWRIVLWSTAIDHIGMSPIFGWGAGQAAMIIKERLGTYMPLHNDYLTILMETGIVGLLLYLFMQISFFVEFVVLFCRNRGFENRVFAAGAIALMVSCFFMHWMMPLLSADFVFAYFWFIITPAYALVKNEYSR